MYTMRFCHCGGSVRRRPGYGMEWEGEQTTAGAPMPLRPPTPSVRTSAIFSQGGRNRLKAVPGYRLPSLENACSLVQARKPPFSNSAPCPFRNLCHVLLHRPASRRTWAQGTPSGEWRAGCHLYGHPISDSVRAVAVLQYVFIRDGKGVDTARRRLCRPRINPLV